MAPPRSRGLPLDGRQKRHLRALAHDLSPVVQVGKEGISGGVVQATDEALTTHELVKVRLPQVDRDERGRMADTLRERTESHLAALTGRIAVLYRAHPEEPRIRLPS
ncbi:MAG TPA: ribosome assembly RNA-binding protein YhbY [Sandaracinaceae bacterium LLY-WYZ-13_1]|nr:ribosome assembly RNA-binding protein YhbY [Sandaracinaceae bacterium LLY-WYZ-13_1]